MNGRSTATGGVLALLPVSVPAVVANSEPADPITIRLHAPMVWIHSFAAGVFGAIVYSVVTFRSQSASPHLGILARPSIWSAASAFPIAQSTP